LEELVLHLEPSKARALCREVFADLDLPEDQAETCADAIMFATLRGLDSHGIISILPGLANRIARGEIDRAAPIEVVREGPSTALMKGNGAAGPVIGARAMRLAIAKAKRTGVGVLSAFNCDHFGAASYYASLAAREGLIGLAMCNAAPAVVPFGGQKAVHGTNPISYAIPRASGPIILDIATSAAAHGQIFKAQRRGQPIPLGWAVDAEGRPTTDASAAAKGALLPFGGHKGYGMGILVDLLTGALAGSTIARSVQHTGNPRERGQSFYMQAIDVEQFVPGEVFAERVEQLAREVHETPPAEGFSEVLLPGDLELRQEALRSREGIPLYEEDWQAMVNGLGRAGIPPERLAPFAPV
jgi:LDH2 family malate/lactate/ureidoglycolate dehydrogenase